MLVLARYEANWSCRPNLSWYFRQFSSFLRQTMLGSATGVFICSNAVLFRIPGLRNRWIIWKFFDGLLWKILDAKPGTFPDMCILCLKTLDLVPSTVNFHVAIPSTYHVWPLASSRGELSTLSSQILLLETTWVVDNFAKRPVSEVQDDQAKTVFITIRVWFKKVNRESMSPSDIT